MKTQSPFFYVNRFSNSEIVTCNTNHVPCKENSPLLKVKTVQRCTDNSIVHNKPLSFYFILNL